MLKKNVNLISGTLEGNEENSDYARGFSNWYLRSYAESSKGKSFDLYRCSNVHLLLLTKDFLAVELSSAHVRSQISSFHFHKGIYLIPFSTKFSSSR